jgi:hypothetical protein
MAPPPRGKLICSNVLRSAAYGRDFVESMRNRDAAEYAVEYAAKASRLPLGRCCPFERCAVSLHFLTTFPMYVYCTIS